MSSEPVKEKSYEIRLFHKSDSTAVRNGGVFVTLTISGSIGDPALWKQILTDVKSKGVTLASFAMDITNSLRDEIDRLNKEIDRLKEDNTRLQFGLQPKE
jgi:hypothetical protein